MNLAINGLVDENGKGKLMVKIEEADSVIVSTVMPIEQADSLIAAIEKIKGHVALELGKRANAHTDHEHNANGVCMLPHSPVDD